jgi:hypothetical protein
VVLGLLPQNFDHVDLGSVGRQEQQDKLKLQFSNYGHHREDDAIAFTDAANV